MTRRASGPDDLNQFPAPLLSAHHPTTGEWFGFSAPQMAYLAAGWNRYSSRAIASRRRPSRFRYTQTGSCSLVHINAARRRGLYGSPCGSKTAPAFSGEPYADHSLEKLPYIITKAREFAVAVPPVDEQSGSNPSDDAEWDVLEASADIRPTR
jgi:hypothetical protein